MTDENQGPRRSAIPTNPGGMLRPEHVLGRDELIAHYWAKLQTQSIALLAPRRVGKTSIATKMIAHPPAGFIVHARDLEDLDSVVHFARAMFEDVESHLKSFTRAATRARAFLTTLGLVEIKDFKIEVGALSWRKLLDRLFADLDEHAAEQQQIIVLIWDEFTYFIGELAFGGREREAMDLLDTLRAARQTHPNIRMVLTGSIGLPEIERKLHKAGHRNRALNDVATEIVPLFDEANARVVIAALARGADLDLSAAIVDELVRLSEGHPLIIQLLVEDLKGRERVDLKTLGASFRALIEPPGDPLDLRYYADRIAQNFDAGEAELVRELLDQLAKTPGQTLTQLLEGMPGRLGRTQLSDLLRHLIDDFYLVREEGQHRFRLEFLRRFWTEERGL